MDRRVAALFGGIVAVGLGPAVWLGGTLFRSDPPPAPPADVSRVTGSPTADSPFGPAYEPLPTVAGSDDDELHPQPPSLPLGDGSPAEPSTTPSPVEPQVPSPDPSGSPQASPSTTGPPTPELPPAPRAG
jgi:hypothetical protein